MQRSEGNRLMRHVSVRGLVMTAVTLVVAAIVVFTLTRTPGGAPDYTPVSTEPTQATIAPQTVEPSIPAPAPSAAPPETSAAPPETSAAPPETSAAPAPSAAPEQTRAAPANAAPSTSAAPSTTSAPPTTTTSLRKYTQPPAPTAWAPNQVHR